MVTSETRGVKVLARHVYLRNKFSFQTRVFTALTMAITLYILSYFLGLPSEVRFPFTLSMSIFAVIGFYEMILKSSAAN